MKTTLKINNQQTIQADLWDDGAMVTFAETSAPRGITMQLSANALADLIDNLQLIQRSQARRNKAR